MLDAKNEPRTAKCDLHRNELYFYPRRHYNIVGRDPEGYTKGRRNDNDSVTWMVLCNQSTADGSSRWLGLTMLQ